MSVSGAEALEVASPDTFAGGCYENPIGFVLWLLVVGWSARVGIGAFIGWLDLNLVAALQRVLIHRVSGQLPMPRVEFVPVRRMDFVSHRVHLVYDPF